ncbi:MAG TPA: type II methionyl aminopeptidase [Methanoregulaceae archaeon]|nr:type II methionyl aminopeptidase [Methanoregulaceae archaeon]
MIPDDDSLFCYSEAGKIASVILKKGSSLIEIGNRVLEIVESIEQMVEEQGCGLAFPLNLSFNEDAAHDTASADEQRVFLEGDVVKLDLGVHLEGYIADTAVTIDLGDNALLIEASKAALTKAIEIVRPGVTSGDLGRAIRHEIQVRGYHPVSNLTGHGLARYSIHTPPSIPNISFQGGVVLEEGMVFAIEPFASTGSGRVSEKNRIEIFQQTAVKPVRLPSARKLLESVRNRHGMPFARRWITDGKQDIALASLISQGIVRSYPVLSDVPGSLVSQHEHTVIVTSDGCIVTTA